MMGESGDGFIDRSKVRILLCDNDGRSSEEVFTLLCRCSYQVTSVKSPRQVIDALNAEGPDIDIILSEVDLPMSKGMKMLKYIMRDKELCRIPVIMMSAKDEAAIVVKCLKLGAADYLVKPLRTNELLNLWTHMWRRRRMLGLTEKNIIKYDLDLVASDPSDATTNSTTLFSDDTDDKSGKSINPETCVSTYPESETIATTFTAPILQTECGAPYDCQPDVPELIDRQTGQQHSPFQKKRELKIGESSAFFTYVKSTPPKSNNPEPSCFNDNPPHHQMNLAPMNDIRTENQNHSQGDSIPTFSVERSSTPPQSIQRQTSNEEFSFPSPYQYYMPGLMNPMPMQPSSSETNHANNSSMMPQYHHMPSYPYYPFSVCQMPAPHHQWPSFENQSKVVKVDRREAALMKFRQKRKERCFDKKIRYVNRKKLAEGRPRKKGQFVRKVNGVSVDLNGQPAEGEDEEDYEVEEGG